ncbi:hypothetical protein P154DRAFT_534811 [Amniculicola lignicola CBS 123094]|uniref:Uncharacterized protein n=1 Tax=Amniculicola lignicola CBS 123094 TaxID=1392246 RepID=A0A6A5WF04_9PLEO|nr:hypothetical protein P154DRAFT_534811 [Amniculicola lignicola CBS 123094]
MAKNSQLMTENGAALKRRATKATGSDSKLTQKDWEIWLKWLTPERESLLIHDRVSCRFPDVPMHDFASANGDVQWNELAERVQDINSLRLFGVGTGDGDRQDELTSIFPKVLQEYRTGDLRQRPNKSLMASRAAPIIAVIAVALNNYRFLWIQGSAASIYIACRAWSREEMQRWTNLSPAQRALACTLWNDSDIGDSAHAMAFPYDAYRNNRLFTFDGQDTYQAVTSQELFYHVISTFANHKATTWSSLREVAKASICDYGRNLSKEYEGKWWHSVKGRLTDIKSTGTINAQGGSGAESEYSADA